MNLVNFFLKNYTDTNNKFYDDFYSNFEMELSTFDLILRSQNEIFNTWKRCLYPEISDIKDESKTRNILTFGLTSFWLYRNNFIIEQYPMILKEWQLPGQFSSNVLKIDTGRKYGNNGQGGGIAWDDRRKYIESLSIMQSSNFHLEFSPDIETIFNSVSSSNTQFKDMTLNEKLRTIRDAMENMGKVRGKYIEVPYETVTSGMITNEKVKEFSSLLQNFRHGHQHMISKRDSFTDQQKLFMVDYGLMLINLNYHYLNNLEY